MHQPFYALNTPYYKTNKASIKGPLERPGRGEGWGFEVCTAEGLVGAI